MPNIFKKIFFLSLVALIAVPTMSLSPSSAIAIKDYSGVAADLFNNMRTPAALIAGSIVPLCLISAPALKKDESKRVALFKKINFLLGVSSLLSEILAITYSTVAINKLAEVKFAPTAGAAELIAKHFELAWIGTNVQFLGGMFGFALLVGSKAYFVYGGKAAKIAGCLSVAAFLQCTSIVNDGIAMGVGGVDIRKLRFAKNLFSLTMKYLKLAFLKAKGRPLSMTAFGVALYSLFLTAQQLACFVTNEDVEAPALPLN
jgi:hypothetical protein